MLGPLRSLEEQRQEQQLQEIQLRRQERERRAAEEDGGARDDSPPVLEKADELTGPFHYEFSYWARSVCDDNGRLTHTSAQCLYSVAKWDELFVLESIFLTKSLIQSFLLKISTMFLNSETQESPRKCNDPIGLRLAISFNCFNCVDGFHQLCKVNGS